MLYKTNCFTISSAYTHKNKLAQNAQKGNPDVNQWGTVLTIIIYLISLMINRLRTEIIVEGWKFVKHPLMDCIQIEYLVIFNTYTIINRSDETKYNVKRNDTQFFPAAFKN